MVAWKTVVLALTILNFPVKSVALSIPNPYYFLYYFCHHITLKSCDIFKKFIKNIQHSLRCLFTKGKVKVRWLSKVSDSWCWLAARAHPYQPITHEHCRPWRPVPNGGFGTPMVAAMLDWFVNANLGHYKWAGSLALRPHLPTPAWDQWPIIWWPCIFLMFCCLQFWPPNQRIKADVIHFHPWP